MTADDDLRRAAEVMLAHHDALVSVPSGESLNCGEAANLRAALAATPPAEGLDVDAFLRGLTKRGELSQEWRDGIEYARLQYAALAPEQPE